MSNQARLARLRSLDRPIGEPFQSQSECVAWSNMVAPLLSFDPRYHEAFLQHASVVIIPSLSAQTYGNSVNHMTSIVKQAIGTLELGDQMKRDEPVDPPHPSPAHVEAATPILSLTLWLGAALGAILLLGGIYLATAGRMAETRFNL